MNGTKIRKAREALQLTQQELADQIGVAQSLIGMLESGSRTSARLPTLLRLAAALDLTLDDLTGTNDPKSVPCNPMTARLVV